MNASLAPVPAGDVTAAAAPVRVARNPDSGKNAAATRSAKLRQMLLSPELDRAASRTYYLDLSRLARLQDQRNTPFTPAVHAYYALVEALELEEQGGRSARAYGLPTELTYTRLHDTLKADGFVIYAGQGNLSKTLFRISTMGELTRTDIDRLLTCCVKLR